jgi:hypothetical protein
MPSTIDVDFHGKSHSDFDLIRIARADEQGFYQPITAYLTSAFMTPRSCVGVVFGHREEDPYGRFSDGRVIQTGVVVSAQKEGRYWVITDKDGDRYVLAAFRREGGRNSLRDYLQMANTQQGLPC